VTAGIEDCMNSVLRQPAQAALEQGAMKLARR